MDETDFTSRNPCVFTLEILGDQCRAWRNLTDSDVVGYICYSYDPRQTFRFSNLVDQHKAYLYINVNFTANQTYI